MISRGAQALALLVTAVVTMSSQADQISTVPVDLYNISLSSDGRAAVGFFWDGLTIHSYRWTTQSRYQQLGRDPWGKAVGVSATISADGKTIAQTILSDSGAYATAGIWTEAGGWRQLGETQSNVYGMTRDAKIVVGELFVESADAWHGFRWSEATGMVDMGSSGANSRILSASADGTVLVGFDFDPIYHGPRPAVWVHGVLKLLDGGRWNGTANAVSADGTVIVGSSNNKPVMWTLQDGALVRTVLRSPDPTIGIDGALPNALSDDGRVVVGMGYTQTPQQIYGFVWTAATGLIHAEDYFKAFGYSTHQPMRNIYTITPNGQTMAVDGGCNSSCLIRRVPWASATSKQ